MYERSHSIPATTVGWSLQVTEKILLVFNTKQLFNRSVAFPSCSAQLSEILKKRKDN